LANCSRSKAQVRSGIEVDSDVVGTVENERRVFVTEKVKVRRRGYAEDRSCPRRCRLFGKEGFNLSCVGRGERRPGERALVNDDVDRGHGGRSRKGRTSPLVGWISAKCVVVVEDISGNLLGAGRAVLDGTGGEEKETALYSNYTAVDHDAMYKALYDAGLQYGPGFRLCRKAWRTDHDAVGMLGPVPGETSGWLVHPALADSMLHLTAIAPKAPIEGWPWLADEEK
jgi:hypothetical protein